MTQFMVFLEKSRAFVVSWVQKPTRRITLYGYNSLEENKRT